MGDNETAEDLFDEDEDAPDNFSEFDEVEAAVAAQEATQQALENSDEDGDPLDEQAEAEARDAAIAGGTDEDFAQHLAERDALAETGGEAIEGDEPNLIAEEVLQARLEGRDPDLTGVMEAKAAAEAEAAAKAARDEQIQDFVEFARDEMTKQGYEWQNGRWVQTSQPVSAAEATAEYVAEQDSAFAMMSDAEFAAFLQARESGSLPPAGIGDGAVRAAFQQYQFVHPDDEAGDE